MLRDDLRVGHELRDRKQRHEEPEETRTGDVPAREEDRAGRDPHGEPDGGERRAVEGGGRERSTVAIVGDEGRRPEGEPEALADHLERERGLGRERTDPRPVPGEDETIGIEEERGRRDHERGAEQSAAGGSHAGGWIARACTTASSAARTGSTSAVSFAARAASPQRSVAASGPAV